MQAPFLLSCKITHSCLKFLERRGEDLEPLYERFDWPLHYLRDPSSWLEADRLEFVLQTLEELYGQGLRGVSNDVATGDFAQEVGHAAPQLRAWGALDSVLRIVPGVTELYHQPERFLSSFMSPPPQVQTISRHGDRTEFRFDFSDDRMPCTARYLKAVLESLPEFIGKPQASVRWHNGLVGIEWSEHQVPLPRRAEATQQDEPSLSPDLLRTILMDLANAQRELESTRRQLQERDAELLRLRSEPVAHEMALHELYKLGDYFARAQQLVTLLRQAVKSTAGSQAADVLIRRTAWERVADEAPQVIGRAQAYLRGEIPVVPKLAAEPMLSVMPSALPLSKASQSTRLSFFDDSRGV